jgi:hypothetical protein
MLDKSRHPVWRNTAVYPSEVNGWSRRSLWSYGRGARDNLKNKIKAGCKIVRNHNFIDLRLYWRHIEHIDLQYRYLYAINFPQKLHRRKDKRCSDLLRSGHATKIVRRIHSPSSQLSLLAFKKDLHLKIKPRFHESMFSWCQVGFLYTCISEECWRFK